MNAEQEKVITALENPDYDWRTEDGIAKETKLSKDDIDKILLSLQDIIVHSSIPDEEGKSLYTTRDHYEKTQSLLTRSLSAITGSVKR